MQISALIDLWIPAATTFLALLFLRAFFHKASDLVRFTGFLSHYRVLPQASLTVAGYGLLACEALVVVLLCIPDTHRFGAALGIGLLLVYAIVIAFNVFKGNVRIECGCGGPAMHLSYALVLRNIMIVFMTLPLVVVVHHSLSMTDAAVAATCGAVLYLLYLAAEQLQANSNRVQMLDTLQ